VVLSTGGWVRSGEGSRHRAGRPVLQERDAFQALARGRSLQPALFIDSTGRTYTLPAHSLPSARGHGEPLSGRLDPPDGAKFAGVMIGEPEDLWLLATDAGYGFTARLRDLITDRPRRQTVLNVPENAHGAGAGAGAIPGLPRRGGQQRRQAARFPGGGGARDAARQGQQALRHSGQKGSGARRAHDSGRGRAAEGESGPVVRRAAQVLEWRDLQDYVGERAQRGAVLRRGWPRNIDRLETRLLTPSG